MIDTAVDPVPAAAYGQLEALFSPTVVAVVGASDDTGKFGGRVLSYLNSGAWSGTVLPVHPRQERVQGLLAAPSIAAANVAIDLAVIAAPQASVESTLAQCAAAGVKAAVVFASGYAEAGDAGRARQRQMLVDARRHGVRLLGPNCIGLVNERERFAATFATMWQDGWGPAGDISVVSQSGAMASYLYVMLRERGLGIAHWCSTGNEADVDVAECIVHLARDRGTRVVMAALEGVASGARLMAALAQARQAGKPVILLKMGRSEVGRAAAASHTGALAGEGRVFDAAVTQAGALLANTFGEAVDMAAAFVTAPPPAGRRIGIVTASGGGGIMAADRAEAVGLDVPELPADLRRRLDALLPGGNSRNPVDVTAMVLTDMELMVAPIAEVASAAEIDALIVFLTSAFRSDTSIDRLIARLHAHGLHRCGKPVLLTLFTSPQGHARLHAAGFPSFLEPVRAVETLAALCAWSERSVAIMPAPTADEVLPLALPAERDEAALLLWLGQHGVPVAPGALVYSVADAVAKARALGPVVAMKISVPGLAHKSDLGGVMLDIGTPEAATNAWLTLRDRGAASRRAGPDSPTRPGAEGACGVIVQRQMAGVVELMLGMRRDPTFGAVVLVGLGGKWVELLDDVAIRVAPVTADAARGMLESLRGFTLLRGARGLPLADVDAAIEAIVAFSHIAARAGQLASAEINPFIVGEAGRGGWAVDAKIVAVTAAV